MLNIKFTLNLMKRNESKLNSVRFRFQFRSEKGNDLMRKRIGWKLIFEIILNKYFDTLIERNEQ